jgi:hypothetical protein
VRASGGGGLNWLDVVRGGSGGSSDSAMSEDPTSWADSDDLDSEEEALAYAQIHYGAHSPRAVLAAQTPVADADEVSTHARTHALAHGTELCAAHIKG